MTYGAQSRSDYRFGTLVGVACLYTALFAPVVLIPSVAFAAEPNAKPVEPPNPALVAIQALRDKLKKDGADSVIQECTKLLEVDAANHAAAVARGIAYNVKGDYDAALADFNPVTKLPGQDPTVKILRREAYAHRSYSLYQKGESLKAVDSAYFAQLETGDHAEAFHYRALAYTGRNQHDKAIYFADRASQMDPKLAEAISTRGLAYGLKGNLDKAIEDQAKAIQMDAGLVVAYVRRGEAYFAKGKPEDAYKDFEKALELKPDCADALCGRSMLWMLKKSTPQAVTELDRAIKVAPNSSRAHFQRGLLYEQQGDKENALKSFSEALRLRPEFVLARCARGTLYQKMKDEPKAIEDFTAALKTDPKNIPALTARNKIYARLGKLAEAKLDADKLKELQPPPAAKTAKKKEDEAGIHGFHVKSKAVAPDKLKPALETAKAIDALVAESYAKNGIKPNELTSDFQFVRRIYLDVVGTIPTYQQTMRFLQSKEADKRSRLIDELLSSDGYASHSFNYWADILRYTDSITQDVRGEPYRQWLKQSLAESKPFDKMVSEMMTAEGLIWQNPATGYLQRDANMPLDNMNNTVRIFLGTRIGCAQCHNHPFDRWTQKEFYQMAAFTIGTQVATNGGDQRYWKSNPDNRLREDYENIEQEEEDRRNNSYRFDRVLAVNMRIVNDNLGRKLQLPKNYEYDDAKPEEVVEPKTLFGTPPSIGPNESPRQAFARWLTSKDNPRFAKTLANRLWQRVFGIGQIDPVDNMMDGTVAENPPLMDLLESKMKDLNFDMKEYLRVLLNTQTYQRQACFDEIPLGSVYHFQGPMLRRMTAEQVWDSFITLAVVKPDEFRELDASIRSQAVGKDLTTVSAMDLLESEQKGNEIDGNRWKRQQKYTYKGELLARASELPSPVPPNHFLRAFGQSDRELIASSSTSGSVPQILFMFNGPITHMLMEKGTTIHNNIVKKQSVPDGVKTVFLTILSREPDVDEAALAAREIKENGPAGYGNVIWSLVNTREFLFVQ